MKSFTILLILACVFVSSNYATAANCNPLAEVNKEWLRLENARYLAAASTGQLNPDDREMIRLHLKLVEDHLRNSNTSHLSPELQARRENSLDNLSQYWREGKFPVNTHLTYRNPIFIDEFDNFCAVGYLIKTSGNEPLSRAISKKSNLSFLREIHSEELNTWVEQSGFSLSELALIQPGYSPITYIQTLGSGMNGPVYTMISDTLKSTIYMGGDFTQAIGALQARKVAAYNWSSKTWSSFGDGFNAPVRKLLSYHDTLFATGSFNESGWRSGYCGTAFWNGTEWKQMGVLTGQVYDIAAFKGNVYIGGDFSFSYNGNTYRNLARWSGSLGWLPVCDSIDGVIQCFASTDTHLFFGGSFSKVNSQQCRNVAAFVGTHFLSYGDGPSHPVHSLAVIYDSVFAAGPISLSPDTLGLSSFPLASSGVTEWSNFLKRYMSNYRIWGSWEPALYRVSSIKSLGIYQSKLVICGGFRFSDAKMGFWSGWNIVTYDPKPPWPGYEMSGIGLIDSTVYTACAYKNGLAMGGLFKEIVPGGNAPYYPWKSYNYIAHTDFSTPNGLDERTRESATKIFPNPFADRATIEFSEPVNSFSVYDLTGRKVYEWSGDVVFEYTLKREWFNSPGLHMIEVRNRGGQSSIKKFQVD